MSSLVSGVRHLWLNYHMEWDSSAPELGLEAGLSM